MSLSSGRLGGGRLGLRTPPSPPTGTEYGRGIRFCVVVHGILPNWRRNLSDQPVGHRVCRGQPTQQRVPGEFVTGLGQFDRAVEHRRGVHVAVGDLEVGQQAAELRHQARPARRDPPERDARLDHALAPAARAPTARSTGIRPAGPSTANTEVRYRMSEFSASSHAPSADTGRARTCGQHSS